jgi:hypothetical protein
VREPYINQGARVPNHRVPHERLQIHFGNSRRIWFRDRACANVRRFEFGRAEYSAPGTPRVFTSRRRRPRWA